MRRGNSFIASKLRWRNFMSFGDNETELDLTGQDIAVLLGENLDSASEDARNGVGKSQPLDSKVLTPDGWRLLGELQLNDKVTTSGGRAARIAGITDQPEPLPGYAVVTVDGRRTRCSGDHNWYVLTDMKRPRNLNTFFMVEEDEPLQWRTLTTEEILRGLESGHEFHLPLHQPPRQSKSEAEIDPYEAGRLVEQKDRKISVPRDYNAPQRYMYLKALLCYPKKGKRSALPDRFIHVATNDPIASEIQKIVWSLGGYCDRRPIRESTQLEIEMQNPNHKRQEQTVQIKGVFQDGRQEQMRCLILAGKDPLYVTDDYIVTHNSTIIDALCFVLFGKTIRGVPNARLVNKWVPKKPMSVELEFQKGEWNYMIERGERPSKLKLYRKPLDDDRPFKKKEGRKFIFDKSRGKTETTTQIMELLGYNITLFEYLVANSSESKAFPVLEPPKQRDVIEKLFGFEIMSQKGTVISEKRKDTRKKLAVAETALSTIVQANERIRRQIAEIEQRSKAWERGYHQRLDELREQIATLSNIDYDLEIENLKLLADIEAENSRIEGELSQARRTKMSAEQMLSTEKRMEKTLAEKVGRLEHEVKHVAGGVCPTCKQSWNTEESQFRAEQLSEELVEAAGGLENQKGVLEDCQKALDEAEKLLDAARHEQNEFNEMLENMAHLEVNFDTIEKAMEAKNRITHLQSNLEAAEAEANPFLETKRSLETEALQPEDDTEVQRLRKLLKHQDFMVKLLTDSNSFVRKQILDQWVPALNKQIHHYMTHFEKPHKVSITPDLHMEITLHQEDYIWKEMSKGERVSTILSTNMAFQDIFEYMNYGINILCIDELLDNGLGPGEARSVMEVLKKLNHTKRKSILLITHRDDIAAQADRTFVAKKQNDISWVEQVQ